MHAQMYNHFDWISVTDPGLLQRQFDDMLRASGFKILNVTAHSFDPAGFTGLWLLAESHFAIHTFPESGRTYIEMSSCNREKFVSFIDKLSALRTTAAA